MCDGRVRRLFGSAGVIPALVTVAARETVTRSLLPACASALALLCGGRAAAGYCPASASTVVAHGGVDLVRRLLTDTPGASADDLSCTQSAAVLCWRLSQTPSNARPLMDVVAGVVAAAQRGQHDVTLAEATLNFLSCLSHADAHRRPLLAHLGVVVAIMGCHKEVVGVVEPGLWFLANQAAGDAEHAPPLLDHVELALSALRLHGDVAIVVTAGVSFLRSLSAAAECRPPLLRHVDAVVACMGGPTTADVAPVETALALLRDLVSCSHSGFPWAQHVPAVLAVLVRHAGVASIACVGLEVLAVCATEPHIRQHLLVPHVDTLASYLTAHSYERGVVLSALTLLGHVAIDSQGCPRERLLPHVPAVLTSLRRYFDAPDVEAAALRCLRGVFLAWHRVPLHAAADAVTAMLACFDRHAVVTVALTFLRNAASIDEHRGALLVHVGAAAAAMALGERVPELVAACLGFLHEQSSVVDGRAVVMQHVGDAVAAMRRHTAVEAVVAPGLCLLRNLALCDDNHVPLMAHVDCVVAVMREHINMRPVVGPGLQFLCNMAACEGNGTALVAHADVVVRCAVLHSLCASAMGAGLGFLSALARNSPNQVLLLRHVETVTSLMDKLDFHIHTQSPRDLCAAAFCTGMEFLGNVSLAFENRQHLLSRADYVTNVMDNVQYWRSRFELDDTLVVEQGLRFLCNLAGRVENRSRLIEYGNSIVTAMTVYPDSDRVAFFGVSCLYALSLVPANVPLMQENGVAAVVTTAVARHGAFEDGNVKRFGERLLAKL